MGRGGKKKRLWKENSPDGRTPKFSINNKNTPFKMESQQNMRETFL